LHIAIIVLHDDNTRLFSRVNNRHIMKGRKLHFFATHQSQGAALRDKARGDP